MTESTEVDAIAALRGRGFDADFSVTADGRLRCSVCGHEHAPEEAVIEATYRFEGASDPDDEATVFGLRCQRCGVAGVLVVAYGPMASAEEAAVVTALGQSRD